MAFQPHVFAASMTPFDRDGSFDAGRYREHLRWLAASGVGVYSLAHGAGEGLQVTHRERLEILTVAAKALEGLAPLHAAGLGLGPSTEEFLQQAKEIAATGVNAMQLFGPRPAYPSNAAKPHEVERYFRDALETVRHPWVLAISNGAVPGVEPRPELVRTLVTTYPHLIGVNMTVTNVGYLRQIVDAVAGTQAKVRIGGPPQLLQLLAYGGDGFLGLEGNVIPHFCAAIVDDWRAGRANEAAEKWRKLGLVGEVLSRYAMPASIKAANGIWGAPRSFVRKPYLDLEPAQAKDLQESLLRLGVKEWESAT